MTAASALASAGLAGPWPLSAAAQPLLQDLIEEASAAADQRNLHVRSELALRVITDEAIRAKVQALFGGPYRLWRTNFFQRRIGHPHPGVSWHHDKHFQDGDQPINFDEIGTHVSIVIGLEAMDQHSGCFQYIPGSFRGSLQGWERDCRPFAQRPIEAHFPPLPHSITNQAVAIAIPAGQFCLFHSALLHGSAPSEGLAARTSMVGRLVRDTCQIPADCASSDQIIAFA